MSDRATPESRPDPPSHRSHDLPALSAVMAESFDDFDRDGFEEYVRAVTDDPRGELIFVRGRDGRPVAGLTVLLTEDERGGRTGWVYDVAVAETERGRHHGDVLLGLAADWASYRGAGVVALDTVPNLGARFGPGDPRSFDPDDPRLIELNLSKAVEYGRQAGYGLDT